MAEVLEAPPEVTIASAKAFADALGAVLAEHDEVNLDLARTASVDLSFVQLVCAARLWASDRSKRFELCQPAPEPVHQLLRRAGVLDRPTASDLAFWLHETAAR